MQNSTFVTECNVIRLYYENAEANILNDLFFETADAGESESKAKEIANKIADKITEIIKSIKEFFEQLKRKHESAKIAQMLRSECARSNKLIKANVKDKEISKGIAKIYKLEQATFVEIRKQYDKFMGHKIDYDTYCRNVDAINDKYVDAVEKITREFDNTKIINPADNAGAYKLSEITKRVNEVANAYTKVMDKMRDDVIKEEEKLTSQAKRDATDNVTSSATSKISAMLSKVNKKAVMAIVSIVSLAGAATFCYNAGQKKGNANVVIESAEDDYFADLLGDSSSTYQEEADPMEGLFDDIVNA